METSHIDLAILNYAANNICLDADRGEASTFIYCFDSYYWQIYKDLFYIICLRCFYFL